jgi:hypothetical protein
MIVLGAKSLKNLLKSGKTLEVFSIKDKYLKKFVHEAKRYGVTYHVIKDKKDPNHMVDRIVDKDNSPMCTRIIERYSLQVDMNKGEVKNDGITNEIQKETKENEETKELLEITNEKDTESKESEIGVSQPFLESESLYKNLLKNNEDFEIKEKMPLEEALTKLKELFASARQKILSQDSISKDKSQKEQDFEL